jgi:hypothetical protein
MIVSFFIAFPFLVVVLAFGLMDLATRYPSISSIHGVGWGFAIYIKIHSSGTASLGFIGIGIVSQAHGSFKVSPWARGAINADLQ